MKQCSICKEFYNPCSLKEVIEHMHNNLELEKDYYGKEVTENEDCSFRNNKRNN